MATAFVAPEVVNGGAPSPAADVYGLAASIFFALTGRAPLGQIDTSETLEPEIDWILERALDADPSARPSAEALATALRRDPASSGRAAPPSMFSAVLLVGGAAVFTGMLALAIAHFSSLTIGWRLGLIGGFTLATFAAGLGLSRSSPRSGVALIALAAELGWADAYVVLFALGLSRSYGAWAVCGAILGAGRAILAVRLRSMLLGASAALAFIVSSATLGLLLPIARQPGPSLFVAGVAGIHAAIGWGARRFGVKPLETPFFVASGLAGAGSIFLSLVALAHGELWALGFPYLVAIFAFLIVRRQVGVAVLLGSVSLQALVSFRHSHAALLAALATLAVSSLFAKQSSSGLTAFASVVAALWSGVATLASVLALRRTVAPLPLELAVPYLLALLHLLAARRLPPEDATMHRMTGVVVLATVPSIQALVFPSSLSATLLVAAAGVIAVAWALRRHPQVELALIGLTASTIAPTLESLADPLRKSVLRTAIRGRRAAPRHCPSLDQQTHDAPHRRARRAGSCGWDTVRSSVAQSAR